MYGPPPNCKRNRTGNSLRKCIRPLVENGLRAHDDDPRVPVLDNRRGRERPHFDPGSQARRLTVFSSFLFFCRLLRSESQATSSSWQRKRLCASGDNLPPLESTAQLIRASLLAVGTITTLRA